ncbi:hypothetical protein BDV41DRAFT_553972 [Aspergillus transmontanensis]|uniref:Uncharacterized protein n=1 Tax=Aspergillus transmontanensis TaxID=1034304 RepID=A0A5N6VKG1_9EURO|nr:hypothetical protein BDV41DRAFT_553972 [Aspergillus transmontanensis]
MLKHPWCVADICIIFYFISFPPTRTNLRTEEMLLFFYPPVPYISTRLVVTVELLLCNAIHKPRTLRKR